MVSACGFHLQMIITLLNTFQIPPLTDDDYMCLAVSDYPGDNSMYVYDKYVLSILAKYNDSTKVFIELKRNGWTWWLDKTEEEDDGAVYAW